MGDFDDFPGMKEIETNLDKPDDDDELEIDIVDDTPEEDRGRHRREGEADVPDPDDDSDLQGYSEGVQKRISKLRAEFHEERRRKEEAERVQQASIEYAQSLQRQLEAARNEVSTLKTTLHDGEDVLFEQAKGRIQSQLEAAKAAYKRAFEEGDADALVEAQATIAKLAGEDQYVEGQARAFKQRMLQQQQMPQPQQQPQQPPPMTEAQREWFAANKWFNTDPRMTGYAYGVHEELYRSGVQVGSKLYFEKIDENMRQAFPDRFKNDNDEKRGDDDRSGNRQHAERGAPVGAPSRGGNGKNNRKVTLTKSQVDTARRLGITPQQYAVELLKIEQQQEAI